MHRYSLEYRPDGDYVVWESWTPQGHFWLRHTGWLIPGTQIED